MTYEYYGYKIIDKIFEAKGIEANSEANKDFIIPNNEKWTILSFNGSTNSNKAEIKFMFSYDNGETWINPYDGTNDILRYIYVIKGYPVSLVNPVGMIFEGDGENTILRIKVKNLDDTSANIVGWFNGLA